MNRNNKNYASANRNVVSPDFFVGEIWYTPNAVTSTGVEIIELTSSTSAHSDKTLKNEDHSWSYANTKECSDMSNKHPVSVGDSRQQHNRNVYFPEAHNLYTHEYENDAKVYQFDHGLNLFTITNRQVLDSDSSECDQFDEIEVFEYDDMGITGSAPHYYSNKQAKHANSFINNTIIPEIFQLEPPVENDLKSVKFCDIRNKMSRVPTPMPASYIPNLDLSQKPTLSTVSEITEPNKDVPNPSASERSSREPSLKGKRDENRLSYLNWLGLSPRQQERQRFRRQRKLKNTGQVKAKEIKKEVFFDAINQSCEAEVSVKPNSSSNETKDSLLLSKTSRSKTEGIERLNVTYVVHKVDVKSVASGRSPKSGGERNHTRFTEYGDAYDRNKCTQVTDDDLERTYARFVSRHSSSTDFTERQSWLRRLLMCFLCYK